MKRTILILAAILTALFAQSQNISGQWIGKLNLHGNNNSILTNNLYELGKWALQSN
jgi:hypothetical protein